MSEKRLTDWEDPIKNDKLKTRKDYDLEKIYEHAHSELSLQQSKRDQIITLYLALCSFLLPFALGSSISVTEIKGLIFIVVGAVGAIFSYIAMRYREYKEVYWLCCQSITVMLSFKTEELDKKLVQQVFYYCLQKKGKSLLVTKKGKTVVNKGQYVRKNIFSAETLHFVILDLMSSFIMGLGAALVSVMLGAYSILIGIGVGLALFFILLRGYFKTCINIYEVMEKRGDPDDDERRDAAFKRIFSKAWFLHFYYE